MYALSKFDWHSTDRLLAAEASDLQFKPKDKITVENPDTNKAVTFTYHSCMVSDGNLLWWNYVNLPNALRVRIWND